jgi:hypothetical protein
MARIAGVDLPRNKRGIIGLTYIYGMGPSTAKAILEKAEIDENTKVEKWTDDNIKTITRIIAEELQDGRAIALGGSDEHQTPDGHWLLSRFAPQERSSHCAASAPVLMPVRVKANGKRLQTRKKQRNNRV